MERDIEKLIGDKIRSAESKPVHWQKADTWSKISASVTPSRKQKYYGYYAAACLVAAMGVATYLVQLSNSNKLYDKINTLSIAIKKASVKSNDASQHSALMQNCETENVCFKRVAKIASTSVKNIQAVNQNTFTNADTVSLLPNDDAIQVVETLPNTKTEKPYRVEPIIGVIIPEEKNIAIAKEKKVKFRFFKSPEKQYANGGDDSKTLFARIN